MKRLATWTLRLYPAKWRTRYAEEIGALMEDAGADTRTIADLLKGAVTMQFSTWSFAKLAIVLGLGGLLLGTAGSYMIAPIYESKGTLRVEPAATGSALNDLIITRTQILSRTALSGMILDPRLNLYRKELSMMPLDDVIERMHSDIRIDPAGSVVNFSFRYPDPDKARMTTALLMQAFVEESFRKQIDLVRQTGQNNWSLQVLDVASLPVRSSSPVAPVLLTTGFLAGVLIVWAWRRLRRKTVLSWRVLSAAIAMGLVGLIAAAVVFEMDITAHRSRLGARYVSSASLFLPNGTNDRIQTLTREVVSPTSISQLMNDAALRTMYNHLGPRPGEDFVAMVHNHLTVTPDSTGHFFSIIFEDDDRYEAMLVVSAVINRFDEVNRTIGTAASGAPATPRPPSSITILDQPNTPTLPVSPNRILIAVETGLAGLFFAAIISLFRRREHPEHEYPLNPVNG